MSPRSAKGLGLGVLLLGFAFLYLPILLLMFYSFNSSRLAMVWAGFSTRAYSDLFADRALMDAMWTSLVVAFWTACTATVLGTLAAMVMTRFKRFRGKPLFGALADRVGRKPMLLLFGIGGAIVSVPVFSALESVRTPAAAFAIVLVPLLLLAAYTSISALVKAELFPAHIRALGVALPYALANTVFGGTAEYVALWFKQSGWERGFYWYVTAMIAGSLIVYLRMRDTRDTSRIVED